MRIAVQHVAFLSGLTLAAASAYGQSSSLPPGFQEEVIATGLANPTGMDVTPDGRVFFTQQGGQIRVVKNGSLLTTPFATLSVNFVQSRGLIGITFDPNFAVNHYVYVYYTTPSPQPHNRISRLTANGDVMVPGSEVVLFELANPTNDSHNGGGIHFGPDGKIYQAVGDDKVSTNGQMLTNLFGKLLRLNPDGSIPPDNPFYNTATGNNRAIWAYGLRNPYTFAFHPVSGRLLINDVGSDGSASREEINEGLAGANYGWPNTEGYTTNPSYVSPVYAYPRGSGTTRGCGVVGAEWYVPEQPQFPAEYRNRFFFADHCNSYISTLDPANGNAIQVFAQGMTSGNWVGMVDLDVSPDGSLYYLIYGSNGNGSMYRIFYSGGNQPPSFTQQPVSQTKSVGQPVTFSAAASGATPLGFQWQRNGTNIAGATSPSYSIASVTLSDNNAALRCIVTNGFGSATSNTAILTVTTNTSPAATIVNPVAGTTYAAGDTISYSGTGTDAEDGTLGGAQFTWQVDFHHNTHTHAHLPAFSGVTAGSFVIPSDGTEKDHDVWYRLYLTTTDSGGLSTTVLRDVLPRKSTINVATSPTGLQVTMDGMPRTAPTSVTSVVGMRWTLGAPSPQTLGGLTYEFVSWSDGGASTHLITTPSSTATYTATYRVVASACKTASSSSNWVNTAFTPLTGTFTAEWDVTPASSSLTGYLGLSPISANEARDLATAVRFNTNGFIQARNGNNGWGSASSTPYTGGVSYHIRKVVNVGARTFSVFVRAGAGAEKLLAQNYRFGGQTSGSQLDNWSLGAFSGSITACNFRLTSGTATPTPTPTAGATPTPTPTATPTMAVPTPTPTRTPTPGAASTPTPPPSEYVNVTPPGSSVSASTHDGNVPANTVDNNLSTRWSGSGDGAWIQYDLGSTRTVGLVAIAIYGGTSRRNRFDLQLSDDGNTWSTVWSGESSGTTSQPETYDFLDANGRYLRYLGHMSTASAWNSVTEVEIYAVP